MSNHHMQLIVAASPCVDGIDLAQLLRDLGEASAVSSAVDLFGLCLAAQRVLTRLQADANGVAPCESALLVAFRKMDACPRGNMLSAMQAMAEQFPRREPATLTLMRGGAQ